MHEEKINLPEYEEAIVFNGADPELTVSPAIMVFALFVNGPRSFLEEESEPTLLDAPDPSDNS